MKESYFTNESLDRQAMDLYQEVADITPKKSILFRPAQAAMVVCDMQSYFLDPTSHAYIPSAKAILDGIVRLTRQASSFGMPVFYTQHINTVQNAGMMSVWWKDLITAENPRCQIVPEIDLALGMLIQKSQYDAFHETRLETLLRDKKVSQVVICGVMTHLCCETTARSAFTRGFEVFFPVDGTATYNLVFHRASLANLAHGFASIVLMSELSQAMRPVHDG